jgi:hypothetical protein
MADEKRERIKEPLQSEFESLPLDEKLANLFKMEAVTLSEGLAYAVKSSSEVVEKMGDVITDIGSRIETEAKKVWQAADSHVHSPTSDAEAPASPQSGSTAKPKGPKKSAENN